MNTESVSKSQDSNSLQTIQRLPKEVVNRIAAGEVIQRPSNAVKELLENCLDAGSTQIQVTIREGGLKLLQVQDNGCGIRLSDLPILCERFTTSKLREFSELNNICTFGFRGEALSSISHVALVTVITRTKDQICAYKLTYRNGLPNGKPVSCAGNYGTTIIAEDLFYNAPLRRNALRNAREEFGRIAEVVGQYAIHYAHKCGFHLRSLNSGPNSSAQDLRTCAGWSRMDAVRVAIGASIAQNLITLNSSQSSSSDATRLAVERFGLRYEGLLTAPNQITSGTSPTLKLNLFINNRLVSSQSIKRAIEAAYASIISRALSSPISVQGSQRKSTSSGRTSFSSKISSTSNLYVYLNLQLPANTLDVNVHPTKAEVHFLHEDEIINGIQDAVHHCLLSSSQVRSFLTSSLPTANLKIDAEDDCTLGNVKSNQKPNNPNFSKFSNNSPSMIRPQEKVRIDLREQTLERFIAVSQGSTTRQNQTSDLIVRDNSKSPDIDTDSDPDHRPDESIDLEHSSAMTPIKDSSSLALKEVHDMNTSKDFKPSKTTNIPPEEGTEYSALSSRPVIKPERSNHSLLQSCSSTSLTSSLIISTSNSTRIQRLVHLESVNVLKKRFESQVNDSLKTVLRSSKYLGLVDKTRCLAQHATELLLVRLRPLTTTLFYQLLVFNFANHGEIVLDEPIPIKLLLTLGYKFWSGSTSDPEIEAFVNHSSRILVDQAPMLWDYFSIRIETDAQNIHILSGLPLLINNYIPNLQNLPIFLVRLAQQVDWTQEFTCFESICRITAEFYALSKDISQSDSTDPKENLPKSKSGTNWTIEHVIWPQLTTNLLPSSYLFNRTGQDEKLAKKNPLEYAFIRLTKLSDLYKVFERC